MTRNRLNFLFGKWIEARIRHCEQFAICISAACQMASKIDFYHSSPCSHPPTTRSFPSFPPMCGGCGGCGCRSINFSNTIALEKVCDDHPHHPHLFLGRGSG